MNFIDVQNGLARPPTAMNRRPIPQSPMEQRSAFMQQAKKIGSDLSQTFLKLEQLTMSECEQIDSIRSMPFIAHRSSRKAIVIVQ